MSDRAACHRVLGRLYIPRKRKVLAYSKDMFFLKVLPHRHLRQSPRKHGFHEPIRIGGVWWVWKRKSASSSPPMTCDHIFRFPIEGPITIKETNDLSPVPGSRGRGFPRALPHWANWPYGPMPASPCPFHRYEFFHFFVNLSPAGVSVPKRGWGVRFLWRKP